jgi:hypothetical protein
LTVSAIAALSPMRPMLILTRSTFVMARIVRRYRELPFAGPCLFLKGLQAPYWQTQDAKVAESGATSHQLFCPECASPLYSQYLSRRCRHQPQIRADEHDHAHRVEDVSRVRVQHAPLDRSSDCSSAASGAIPLPPGPRPATVRGTSRRRASGNRAPRRLPHRTPRRIAR